MAQLVDSFMIMIELKWILSRLS